jgi:hypothetical protein
MLKNNQKKSAQNSTSTGKSTEIYPSKEAVHAAMMHDPNLKEAKTIWDGVVATAKRVPDHGVIRDVETMRFNPPAAPGQKRVACYI